MKFWYLFFLLCCFKQTSVVNCFDIAGPLIDAADLYKETATLNSDLVNNIEPLLLTYEDAFDEISDDFSEKIKPLLKIIDDHLYDYYLTFNGSNETEDFNISNLLSVCLDESVISNVAGSANSYICDEEESLIEVSSKARKTLKEYITNAILLRSSTANLLYHKTNELTKTAFDKVKDYKYTNWLLGYTIDYGNSIITQVFEPLDKCLKLITTSPENIIKCVQFVYYEMEESVQVKALVNLDESKWKVYNGLLEEYEKLIDRVITITNIIDNKMLFITENIIDAFFNEENKCFSYNFHYTLINQVLERLDDPLTLEVKLKFLADSFGAKVGLKKNYFEAYVDANKKIESFIPCFIKHIETFVVDKAEEFIDVIELNKIIEDVQEEVSNVMDASVSILKPFFEEFGLGCAKALEEFETLIGNLQSDIKECDLMFNINQLSDSCSKPLSIENSQSINKVLKELPESAAQLETCVQEIIAKRATGIYEGV